MRSFLSQSKSMIYGLRRFKRARAVAVGVLVGAVGLSCVAASRFGSVKFQSLDAISPNVLTKEQLSAAIGGKARLYQFPTEVAVDGEPAVVQYAFDSALQDSMEKLMRDYAPDYGAFVAMDASTGRVLSMVSFTRDESIRGNLALRATFPSASVFKVVTAAAAIETQKYNANTLISYSGSKHTLYKRAVFENRRNRWTQTVTLKSAFANSINSVFGKVGAFTVGSSELKAYADRFAFNRPILADVPVDEGRAPIPEDAWGLAESASGFTRDNTMSPLQGAMIAASIAHGGVMMEPYLVQSVYREDGTTLYSAEPKIAGMSVDARTAEEMKRLMRETVASGTSRKSFRGFNRGAMAFVDVGGKTGSLTGTDPVGKYDWFVGYATSGANQIAYAALTVHTKYWRVKSAYLARRAIETYFRDKARVPRNVAYAGAGG